LDLAETTVWPHVIEAANAAQTGKASQEPRRGPPNIQFKSSAIKFRRLYRDMQPIIPNYNLVVADNAVFNFD
jgi:hypothetical protein